MPPRSTTGGQGRPLHGIRRAAGALAVILLALAGVGAPAQPTAPAPPSSGGAAVPAARYANNVAIITIDREIDAITARSVTRRMKEAEAAGADAIVFELNTPGGEVGAVLEICNLIKRSPIPNTVAWINNQAYSGGAIIALACREIVVTDAATMGDAAVINLYSLTLFGGMKETERQKLISPMLSEVVDSARRRGYDEKLVQGIVTRGVELWVIQDRRTGQRLFIDRDEHRLLFGDPPETERIILPSAPVAPGAESPFAPAPPSQDDESTVAGPNPGSAGPPVLPSRRAGTPPPPVPTDPRQFIPASPEMRFDASDAMSLEQELYSRRPVLTGADRDQWTRLGKVADGKGLFTFRTQQMLSFNLAAQTVKNDDELKAFFGASSLVRLNESWSELLVVYLSNLIVKAVLILIFLVALFLEMTHPGLILPGAIAATALVLLVGPLLFIDLAAWWAIAAILLGIGALLLEFFVLPGFGIFGVLGLLLLFVGLLGAFVGPSSEGLFPNTTRGRHDLAYGVVTLVLSAGTSGVLVYLIGKHIGSLPVVGRLVLKDDRSDGGGLLAAMGTEPAAIVPGMVGTALTPLRPSGRVQVGDQIIDAVSDLGFVIPAGSPVRIVSADQFRTSVELLPPSQVNSPGAPGPHPPIPPIRPGAAGGPFA